MLTLTRIPQIAVIVNPPPTETTAQKRRRYQRSATMGICPWCKTASIRLSEGEQIFARGNGTRDYHQCTNKSCSFEIHAFDPEGDVADDLTELANFITLNAAMWPTLTGQIIRDPKTGAEEIASVEGAYDTTSGEVLMIYYPGREVSRRMLVTMDGQHWLQLDNGRWIPAPPKYSRFYNSIVQRRVEQSRREAA